MSYDRVDDEVGNEGRHRKREVVITMKALRQKIGHPYGRTDTDTDTGERAHAYRLCSVLAPRTDPASAYSTRSATGTRDYP